MPRPPVLALQASLSFFASQASLSLLLIFAAGCSPGAGPGSAAPGAGSPWTQLAPPDFELSTVDGKSERLSEHLGKEVVLLDFWATFCEPCLAGMPHLDALYREHHAQGFVIFGISIDGPDSVAQVKTTVSKLGISFPILLDQETRVVALYNPKTSAPFSVLIGRDGRILKKQEGYTTGNASVLDRDVADALARRAPERADSERDGQTLHSAWAINWSCWELEAEPGSVWAQGQLCDRAGRCVVVHWQRRLRRVRDRRRRHGLRRVRSSFG